MNFREADWVGIVEVNHIYIVAVERVRGAPPICIPHCALNVRAMRQAFDKAVAMAAPHGHIEPFTTHLKDLMGAERRYAVFSSADPQWLPEAAFGGMQ